MYTNKYIYRGDIYIKKIKKWKEYKYKIDIYIKKTY